MKRPGWGILEFAVALLLIGLVVAIAWALTPMRAWGAENSQSVTGIPVEYLFAVIGALLTVVYADIRQAIRALKQEAAKRGRHIRHVESCVRLVCNKLNINYQDADDE